MNFAKWIFRIAGLYGLVVMIPLLFMEESLSRQFPPAISHPEYYYGFVLAVIAWQVAFLIMSRDPLRHRPMMLAAVLEKLPYVLCMSILMAQGRTPAMMLGLVVIDGILGVLFVIAYLKTRPAETAQTARGMAAQL